MFHAKYIEVLAVLEIHRSKNSLKVLCNTRYKFSKNTRNNTLNLINEIIYKSAYKNKKIKIKLEFGVYGFCTLPKQTRFHEGVLAVSFLTITIKSVKLLFKNCGNPQPGSLKNVSKSIFNEDETQPIWNHDDTF